ncbi:unnamed protein product, partial [Ectocarpus sp. 8 AP-2014]
RRYCRFNQQPQQQPVLHRSIPQQPVQPQITPQPPRQMPQQQQQPQLQHKRPQRPQQPHPHANVATIAGPSLLTPPVPHSAPLLLTAADTSPPDSNGYMLQHLHDD